MGIGKKITDYLLKKGITAILSECNWDIKDTRNKIIRELKIPKGTDISRPMKKIKKIMYLLTEKSCASRYVQEFLIKLNNEVENE